MPNYGPVYSVGRYWGKAIAQSLGKSKNKGTPQFAITFDIKGAVDTANPEGELLRCEESQRTVYWYFTDKTVEFVTDDLERLGFNKPSLRFLDPNVTGFFDFAGTEIELYCKHEPYDGQLKERWSLSNPREGMVAEPLETIEVRKLDALFGKSLKALASKAAANAPVPVSAETASQIVMEPEAASVNGNATETVSVHGDEIPF